MTFPTPPSSGNLYADIPASGGEETFTPLFSCPGFRVERIVSSGHSSPPGFWYDQAQDEWVSVLQGEALLQFADEAAPRRLAAGDFVCIPAHRRHRVEWTDPDRPTVWLAIHSDIPGKD
ncbi:MAG: cupin domain-containing protein [Betaproteobacteria bacterium]|nr:cupin domain-containing protein [Betaproteobacteria bacterium]